MCRKEVTLEASICCQEDWTEERFITDSKEDKIIISNDTEPAHSGVCQET